MYHYPNTYDNVKAIQTNPTHVARGPTLTMDSHGTSLEGSGDVDR